MITTITGTARRFALTLTVAGVAALGSVAVAPVASAAPAQDGPSYIIEGNGNGPDAFVVTSTGRIPVFFCEDVKPGKDGVPSDKDVAKAQEKAAKEAQKAADEADKAAKKAADESAKAAKKAADEAEKAAKAADKAADKAVKDAAKKAAEQADKAAKDAEKAAKDAEKAATEIVDKVMKQHNICLPVSPGSPRF